MYITLSIIVLSPKISGVITTKTGNRKYESEFIGQGNGIRIYVDIMTGEKLF